MELEFLLKNKKRDRATFHSQRSRFITAGFQKTKICVYLRVCAGLWILWPWPEGTSTVGNTRIIEAPLGASETLRVRIQTKFHQILKKKFGQLTPLPALIIIFTVISAMSESCQNLAFLESSACTKRCETWDNHSFKYEMLSSNLQMRKHGEYTVLEVSGSLLPPFSPNNRLISELHGHLLDAEASLHFEDTLLSSQETSPPCCGRFYSCHYTLPGI